MDLIPERPHVVLLTDEDRRLPPTGPALVGPDGVPVPLPPRVYQALALVNEILLQGYAAEITPLRTELPLDRAAAAVELGSDELLHYVAEGKLPVRTDHQVTWVRLADVLTVNADIEARRDELMQLLADEPWDEDPPTDGR